MFVKKSQLQKVYLTKKVQVSSYLTFKAKLILVGLLQD